MTLSWHSNFAIYKNEEEEKKMIFTIPCKFGVSNTSQLCLLNQLRYTAQKTSSKFLSNTTVKPPSLKNKACYMLLFQSVHKLLDESLSL